MKVKILNHAPDNNRVKLVKTPTSKVVLDPQPGAVSEDTEGVSICLSPGEPPLAPEEN